MKNRCKRNPCCGDPVDCHPPHDFQTPAWIETFNNMAVEMSRRSKDSTKVGAVLIGTYREILLSTYNGPPIGVRDDPTRFDRTNGVKYRYASHAEQNLIAFAARRGIKTDGLTVYCTHNPCPSCTRSLLQAGIKHIWYNEDNSFVSDSKEDQEAVRLMCQEAGVTYMGLKLGRHT